MSRKLTPFEQYKKWGGEDNEATFYIKRLQQKETESDRAARRQRAINKRRNNK